MAEVKRQADEQKIRDLDVQWGEAACRGDLDAVVAFYAADGSLVWPGQAAFHGTAAIRGAWQDMFRQYKGLNLRFTPERIDVAGDGGLASDFGAVALGYDDDKGRQEVTAKYLVVWRKDGGEWKVLYDSYNSNTPDA